MTDWSTARPFLTGEIEALEPFEFVAVVPLGRPVHMVEVVRAEGGGLEVRVPGRPPMVPELPTPVRRALLDRGFASEDASDRSRPWVRAVPDAEAAVELTRAVLAQVFAEKSDATLDIGHGSHRAEHEGRRKLALARERIEPIVRELLGREAEQDEDGDYLLPIGEVHVIVAPRATPDAQVVVRIFAITNVGIHVTPDLGLFLARLNFGLMFGRFALDTEHRSIWFDETLLGEQFREEELRFAIGVVASTADAWDDRLKQMFGGATHQEVLAGLTAEPAPSLKPGTGVGMYL